MKRALSILFLCCVLLGCAACGNGQTAEPVAGDSEQTTEPAEADAPMEGEAAEAPVEEASASDEEVAEEPAPEETEEPAAEPVLLSNGMSADPADYDASVPATNKLRDQVQDKFTQELFEDSETGLNIDFNLLLPEGYGSGETYPLVIFLSDASIVGKEVIAPVIQCRGAMVWATDAWQEEHPCIVAVPQFYTAIINDNNGVEEITDYVESVGNLIRMLCDNYDVDTNRVYGMGQSMGCMVTMYLDAKYDDLYTACLFVDGQWNIEQLQSLTDRKFIYFAAEGDQKASTGMAEVKELLTNAGVSYSETVWNAQDDQALLNEQALELLSDGNDVNFVSWQIGSVVGKPGEDGGMREHMASFDFAFRQTVLREWLFAQSK